MGQHLAVGSSQLEDGSCAVLSPDFQDHILIFSLFFFFTSRVPYVLSFLVEPVVGKGGFYTEESVLEQL